MMIKKILVSHFFFFFIITVSAQVNVKFILKEHPNPGLTETIYVAGSFNTWNPSDNRYKLLHDGNIISLNLTLNPGNYEYKFTRGGWNKVEVKSDGKDTDNRILKLTKDTVINILINGWKDDFKPETVTRKNTASKQVSILDSAFYIPQLNTRRRIWIYLPYNYTLSKKHFPVLYMHDGQNLFDEATSGFGEWGVDECLDSLFRKGTRESIVIGIDNGTRRMNEYNPYEFQSYGSGEGDKYVDFVVNTLKPYIDKNFRTKRNKKKYFYCRKFNGWFDIIICSTEISCCIWSSWNIFTCILDCTGH